MLSSNIQLPECVPIDYMHAVLEGVFKGLMKSWFDSSNHRMPFYLGRDVKIINKKAKQICPSSEFTRTIRPIEMLAYCSGGSRIYRRGVQDCNARARKILGATPTFDKPHPQNAFRKSTYISDGERKCYNLASKLV